MSNISAAEITPVGNWWADWASTSNEWIQGGSETGGAGAAYDYAVLHVKPESGSKSLEEPQVLSTWTSPPRQPPTGRAAKLVSNTSIGPEGSTWLAGPQRGERRGAVPEHEQDVRRPVTRAYDMC